jgi:hypothetical protein
MNRRRLSPLTKLGVLVAVNLALAALTFGGVSSREPDTCMDDPPNDCYCQGFYPGEQCIHNGATYDECTAGPWSCPQSSTCYTRLWRDGEPQDEPCGYIG